MLRSPDVHLVGADVLRDSAGFGCRYVGFADRIQKRCFSVIHVTHNGDYGRTCYMIFRFVGDFLLGFGFLLEADHVGPESEFGAHFFGGIQGRGPD